MGLDWKQNHVTANSQSTPKPTLYVPQHTVLAYFLHSNSCESLSGDFIRGRMGCFLGEPYMLIHIGLFSRITEYNNEGHLWVAFAASPAIPCYSHVSVIAVCMCTCGAMLSGLSPIALYNSQYWWRDTLAGGWRGSKAGQEMNCGIALRSV